MAWMQHFRGIQHGAAGRRTGALVALALAATVACDILPENPPVAPDDSTTSVKPGHGKGPKNPHEPPPPEPPTPPDSGPTSTLTRAPYLQMLGQRSVIIAFRTADAVPASIDYGSSQNLNATATGAAALTHAIVVDNLSPGQRYYYRLRTGAAVLASGAEYFFDTDAGPGDPEFSFFASGDIGESGGKQAVTASRVLQTSPRAEIGLILGDVVYPDGESADYDANLMRPWALLMRSVAIWPALGNHDWHVNPDANFRQEWTLPNNEHYYSYDRGNAHFIALDTRDGDIYDRSNQVSWLRSDLAAHREATWTFVYYHHPGRTCTYKGNNSAVIGNFLPVFDEFHVDVVFTGHAHTYERLYPMRGSSPVDQAQDPNYTNPRGTVYITSGCGAKVEGTSTPDCRINAYQLDETILFTHVTVRGRQLTIRAIESASGRVRDQVTITKSAAL